MTQGYIILGIDVSNDKSNIRRASALSMSLKLADSKRKTCVVVRKLEDVPVEYDDSFDFIVELPYDISDYDTHNLFMHFWQLYYCTPFDDSIFVNTNSIAIDNISSLWDMVESPLMFSNMIDFRGEIVNPKIEHHTQKFETGIVFFQKSEITADFFKMADPVLKSWRDIYNEYLIDVKPDDFDLTVLLNLVAYMLDENYSAPKLFDFTNLANINTTWMDNTNIWYSSHANLKINNYRQSGIVYYGDVEFITDEKMKLLNDNNRTTT